MIILGIDPGQSGAIASISEDANAVGFIRLDVTEKDISDWFAYQEKEIRFAYIEKVHSMPRQGVASSFKFGVNYGFLRGCLISHGIPFEEVTPQRWQKAMGCLTKGDKNISKARAQQLFPDIKITHAIADAILLAEYGRRLRAGELA